MDKQDQQHPQTGPEVEITVDGGKFRIHRGHQPVSAIKTIASVPAAYELDQVIEGKLVPLPDDGGITLKGGEVFVSHIRNGAVS